MSRNHADSVPKYEQIAIEVARRIVDGELAEGERVSGRSSVSSKYHVSPETARRAFCILAEHEVVTAEKGSGMRVRARENAAAFLRGIAERKDIETVKRAVEESIERQKQEMERLNTSLADLITATEHYRAMNPLAPFMIRITRACRFIGRTIREVQLWQQTGATLVAVRRDGELLLSPGPYATFREGDVIYFVAQDLSDRRIREYLYAPAAEPAAD